MYFLVDNSSLSKYFPWNSRYYTEDCEWNFRVCNEKGIAVPEKPGNYSLHPLVNCEVRIIGKLIEKFPEDVVIIIEEYRIDWNRGIEFRVHGIVKLSALEALRGEPHVVQSLPHPCRDLGLEHLPAVSGQT